MLDFSKYRSRYVERGDHPCFLCGREVNVTGKHNVIILDSSCSFLLNNEELNDEASSFPIGPECAKRLPKEYIH